MPVVSLCGARFTFYAATRSLGVIERVIRDAPCPLWQRRSSISSSLLRTGRRHPTNREGSAESIEDRQGIRSTRYVFSRAWFGDGRAYSLFPSLGYSSSLIYRLVFSPSLEEKLGGVASGYAPKAISSDLRRPFSSEAMSPSQLFCTHTFAECAGRFWCKFQKRSARGLGHPRRKGVTRLSNRA
jgi:hypothetical protein